MPGTSPASNSAATDIGATNFRIKLPLIAGFPVDESARPSRRARSLLDASRAQEETESTQRQQLSVS